MDILEKIDMYLNEKIDKNVDALQSLIVDYMRGTERQVTKEILYEVMKKRVKKSKNKLPKDFSKEDFDDLFNRAFNDLVSNKFLEQTKKNWYKWDR